MSSLPSLWNDAVRYTRLAHEAKSQGDYVRLEYYVRRQTETLARLETKLAERLDTAPNANPKRPPTAVAPEPAARASMPTIEGTVPPTPRPSPSQPRRPRRPQPRSPLTGADLQAFRKVNALTFRALGAMLDANPGTLARAESRPSKALPATVAGALAELMEAS